MTTRDGLPRKHTMTPAERARWQDTKLGRNAVLDAEYDRRHGVDVAGSYRIDDLVEAERMARRVDAGRDAHIAREAERMAEVVEREFGRRYAGAYAAAHRCIEYGCSHEAIRQHAPAGALPEAERYLARREAALAKPFESFPPPATD